MPEARVLVVDDEPFIARILTFALEREGYAVATASDGDEAIELAVGWCPDVILLDVMMPKRNGLDVCRALRADRSIARQPHIIVLTARGQEVDRLQADEAGVDAFVTKPFSPTRLLGQVREALGQTSDLVADRGLDAPRLRTS